MSIESQISKLRQRLATPKSRKGVKSRPKKAAPRKKARKARVESGPLEALAWLKANKNRNAALEGNAFGTTRDAIAMVRALYRAGAAQVQVDGLYDEPWRIQAEGGPYADTLRITCRGHKACAAVRSVLAKRPPDELTQTGDIIRAWWD